ncbi:MAG: putative toxin-antitoxin system toxin component, PIN family [Pseudomonadota bacterium]
MSKVRWSIVVRDEVDRALRSYLARRGTKKGDLSRFVEEAVQAHLFEFITSEWQLAEFRRVSHYPKLCRYLKPFEAGNLVNGLRNQAIVLGNLPEVDLSPDPDDNPVPASAIAGEAEYIITGDKRDLLSLRRGTRYSNCDGA